MTIRGDLDRVIDRFSKLIGDLQVNASNDRHRIVAVERKVETLVRLELEDAELIPKEIDAHPDPRLLTLRDSSFSTNTTGEVS